MVMDSITTDGASSSSSFTHSWTYDVFLSFRGEDTRYTFTDHLHSNLVRKGISTFIDDELERGEEISQALIEAIEGSMISIIIFSENYASSKWCLDELVHIHRCNQSKQQMVFPIFYKVDPSDVRHQRGSFGEAIANHEGNFKNDMQKVLRWKAALVQIANLSGWHFSDGHESKFIHIIVEEISLRALKRTDLNVADHPVGIESRVQHVAKLLHVGGSDVHMVGIWGIGGIGKTTIARAVYNLIAHKFEGSCFLENVREESRQHGGLVKLQNILLSKILGGKELGVTNVNEGINVIKKRLGKKRVLLVVDDVDQLGQLRKLVGGSEWFGLGSIIIITTRDEHLLVAHQVNLIYKVNELDHHEAFELFSAYAFPGRKLPDDYLKLASTVVQYADGLPLALVVLGSALCGRSIEDWEDALNNYKKVPNPEIQETLEISYNSLEDPVKEVFLDISCFFKGESKNHVIRILESCGHNPSYGIKVLKEKALIYITEENHIWMHDLLEEMAKEVVRRESPNEPGKRSRLWFHEDIYHVLTQDTGTDKVKGIMVKLPIPCEIRLTATSFLNMRKLKLLITSNAHFSGYVMGSLPSELRFIDWPGFPFESLQFNGTPHKQLVRLNMPHSFMSRLVEGSMDFRNLKWINLENCQFLTEFPDVSGFPNLEDLNLNSCTSLVSLHNSVGFLHKLVSLSLSRCRRLRMFPSMIALTSLKYINLRGCRDLSSFPRIVKKMECLTRLDLSGTAIEHLPSSIGYLIGLEELILEKCKSLTTLPSSIYELQHLTSVNLFGCRKLVKFPGWSSESLPANSDGSSDLWYLNLSGCKSLQEIPELPPKVEWVNAADCVSLERFAKLSNILEHKELQMIECIELFNCRKLCDHLAHDVAKIEDNSQNKVSRLCTVFLSSKQSEFDIVFPGSEVPKWFTYREDLYELSDTSEFSFDIRRNFKLENIGLAICSAVEINRKELAQSRFGVEISHIEKEVAESNFGRCSFVATIDINSQSVASCSFHFEAKNMKSAHVWLIRIPFAKFANCPLPPFTCRVSLGHTSQGLVCCKSYGVHLDLEADEAGKFLEYYYPHWRNMDCLTCLDLSRTAIRELPSSIRYLVSLRELTLEECEELTKLPCCIYELQYLGKISLLGCPNLVTFPKWSANSLPNNLNIPNWRFLDLCGCKNLEEIPELPPEMEELRAADCVSLERFAKLSNILEHKESRMSTVVMLFNCQKLCDNLAHDVASVENIPLNEVSLCSLFLTCKQSEFEVVFPGSEVPKWFNHRRDLYDLSDESEFCFEIPLNFKPESRGLAICAAVENNQKEKDMMQSNFGGCFITARIHIDGENDLASYFYFDKTSIESAHLWLIYIPFVKFVGCALPPFRCVVALKHTSDGSVCCNSHGVHLVMPQDEDLKHEDDEDLKDEDDESNEALKDRDDERKSDGDSVDEYFSCEDDGDSEIR